MAKQVIRAMFSAAYVRECLSYNPLTGMFLWQSRPIEHFADAAHGNTWNTRYAGNVAGFPHRDGYRQLTIGNIKFMEHRIAWLLVHGEPIPEIDHIDGNRSNNRIGNLRAATRAENLANARRRPNNSGVKGVWFDAVRGKFQVHIRHLDKQYNLGRFDTLEEASAARREAAERLHGEFARHE